MAVDFLSAILMTVMTTVPETAAQTVKTIDRQGAVNYSTRALDPSQTIPDRISVIGPDPYFAKAAADLRLREAQRAEYEERDYQRRMQAMMYMQTVPSFASYDPYPASWASSPYYSSYYPGYYGGSVYYRPGLIAGGRPVHPAHPIHPSRPPQVSHHASRSHSGTRSGGGRGR